MARPVAVADGRRRPTTDDDERQRAHARATTAASPKIAARPTPSQVLERPEPERREAVAHLVEGDQQPGDATRRPRRRSRWPKLIVSGSSAEQPRPARPNTSTPRPRVARRAAARPAASATAATNGSSRYVARLREARARSPRTGPARPSPSPRTSSARSTRSPSTRPIVPVMYSVAQLPLVVSTMPYSRANAAKSQNARRQAAAVCGRPSRTPRRRDLQRQPGADHEEHRRSGSPRERQAPPQPMPRKTADQHRRQRRPEAEQRVEVQHRPVDRRREEGRRPGVERRHRQPEADPRLVVASSSITYGSGPRRWRTGSTTSSDIAATSPTSPARNIRLTPEPPRQPRAGQRRRDRRDRLRQEQRAVGRARQPVVRGLVRIELAAGNVTSATPWTGRRRRRRRPRSRPCVGHRRPAAVSRRRRRRPRPLARSDAATPSRSSRWSPTRSALAMAVSAGFTAPMLGKKLVSTTYRLSSSWALQLTSSDRGGRVGAEADGARLVGDARDRDLVLEVGRPRDQVVRVHPEVAEHRLELVVQPLLRLLVVGRVAERDVAVLRQRDPVLRPAGRSSVESQKSTACLATSSRRERRRELGLERLLAAEHRRRRLADHLDVAHRELEVLRPEVEVVDAQRLLELRRVGLLRDRQDGRAVVEHVVAADLVGAVGEPVGMAVVRRRQQQLGRVGGAGRDHDDVAAVGLGRRRPARPRRRSPSCRRRRSSASSRGRSSRSVTLGCSSAGRTPKISASDLAWTSDGKPSQVAQRMHGLLTMSFSSSRTPHGAWNGW